MRDLTKAVTSYTWAMSVFGVQQTLNLFGLGGGGSWNRSTRSFCNVCNVTDTATREMGETMQALFRGGDNLQRGMVDLLLLPLNLANICSRDRP